MRLMKRWEMDVDRRLVNLKNPRLTKATIFSKETSNFSFTWNTLFQVMKVRKKDYHPCRIVDFQSGLRTLGNREPHPRQHDVDGPTLGYIVYIVVWCWRKLLPDTLINHKQIGQCLNHHGNGTRCLAIRNTSCPWVRYWFVDCLRTGGLDTWITKIILFGLIAFKETSWQKIKRVGFHINTNASKHSHTAKGSERYIFEKPTK